MNSDQIILDKINKIMQLVIVSSEFNTAYKGILLCAEKNKIYAQPFGCLLLAKGGLGKTTLYQTIVKKHPPTYRTEGGFKKSIVPVFYIEVPSPATVKSVASCMLNALHDPAPFSGSTAQMNHKLVELLKVCETRLIFIDEFHHLFDLQTSTKRMNTVVCNWIKTLVNETGICFCLVGLPEFESLLKIDSQLARRFSQTFKLNQLRVTKIDEPGTLHAFLHQISLNIEKYLHIKFEPSLTSQLLALQIYIATNGHHAYLMLLLESCLFQVMKKDKYTITIEEFIKAWDDGITSYVSKTKSNPFRLDMTSISSKIRNT